MTAVRADSSAGLDESDALFRAFFEAVPHAVLIADDERRYVAANAAAGVLLGVHPSEIPGRRLDEFSAGGADLVELMWRQFLEKGTMSGEYVLRCPDGTLRHVHFTSRASFTPGRHLCVLRDISERIRSEQRTWLEQGVQRLLTSKNADVLESVLELVAGRIGWDVAVMWGLDERSEALRYLSGWSTDARARELLTASASMRFRFGQHLVGSVWAAGAPRWIEHLATESNFARREAASRFDACSWLGLPLRARGEVVGVVEFFSRAVRPSDTDLSALLTTTLERVATYVEGGRTAAALRTSQLHFELVLRSVTDGVVAITPEGNFVYANEAAARMHGFASVSEYLGTSSKEVQLRFPALDESGRALRYDELPSFRVLRGAAVSECIVHVQDGPTGRRIWSVSGSPVFGEDCRVVLGIMTFRDVTHNLEVQRSRQAESEARTLARQLAEVVDAERRRIAHDLHDSVGQTLAIIKLGLERAARGSGDGRAIEESLSLLAGLIREIRSMTFDLHPAMLDDLGLVPTLLHYAEQASSRTGLEVSVHEHGTRKSLNAPAANYLFRAVKELVSNAAKHAQAQRVDIILTWSERGLCIEVRDDGIGFKPAQPTGHRPGLGLAGVRERLAALGGTVAISGDGIGSSVALSVPLANTG